MSGYETHIIAEDELVDCRPARAREASLRLLRFGELRKRRHHREHS
jgi:hypothetical protein